MIHTPLIQQPDGRSSIILMTPPSVKRDIKELFDLVDAAYQRGEKGAIFCQINEKKMSVTFMPQSIAKRIADAVKLPDSEPEDTHS